MVTPAAILCWALKCVPALCCGCGVLWLCGATTHSAAGLSCCWLCCCIPLFLLLQVLHNVLLQAHRDKQQTHISQVE